MSSRHQLGFLGSIVAALVLCTAHWFVGGVQRSRRAGPSSLEDGDVRGQDAAALCANAPERPSDIWKAMADRVVPYGYPLDEHFVTTSDGYILRLFRMPHGLNATPADGAAAPRPVVFLQHALLDSSAGYVVMGPGRSLAFILADAGYDVWMTNVRGNRFSRNHTSLDPDDPRDTPSFWAFSWDHHASLDLPAAVEYVAAAAGVARMHFVGCSQGTTIGLAALASQPSVVARVASAVMLAPVAFVSHMTSPPFRAMADWRADALFRMMGMNEYGGYRPGTADATVAFCSMLPAACASYLFLICGKNPQPGGNLDRALLPAIMRFLPSGTSVHNMQHWSQLVRARNDTTLTKYDFGSDCTLAANPSQPEPPVTGSADMPVTRNPPDNDDDDDGDGVDDGDDDGGDGSSAEAPTAAAAPRSGPLPRCNQEAYGQAVPPQYSLSSITTPLALLTGGHDTLSDPQDVALLLRVLPGTSVALHHHEPDYGHLDFTVGEDAHARIFPLVLQFLAHRQAAGSAHHSGGGAAV